MLEKVRKIWTTNAPERRRKRALDEFRRQFTGCGYALDDVTDSQLEAAITRGERRIEKIEPLTGKAIYWTLRRISSDVRRLQMRKTKQSALA